MRIKPGLTFLKKEENLRYQGTLYNRDHEKSETRIALQVKMAITYNIRVD